MRINVIYVCLRVHMICLFQLPPSPVPGLQANTIIQSLLALLSVLARLCQFDTNPIWEEGTSVRKCLYRAACGHASRALS